MTINIYDMIAVQLPNGKTRYFKDVIEYLKYTDDGFQKIIADDIGKHIDTLDIKVGSTSFDSNNEDVEIEGLPELPPEEWNGK